MNTTFQWTERRRELLRGLAGKYYPEISPEAFWKQISKMRKAAGVTTDDELIAFARKWGLIPKEAA